MVQIFRILSNRMWRSIVLYILIAATACQQGKPQLQEKATEQVQSRETGAQEQRPTKKDSTMAFYLTRFSYTPETWARMMKNPEDRRVAARKYIESVGGKLHGFWYAFGEYDGYCLWEAPDNVSMAAVGIAIIGGGALSKFETTVLVTVDETLDALRRAQSIGYRLPGTK
jgi:uncharacterized protein with GYD domain